MKVKGGTLMVEKKITITGLRNNKNTNIMHSLLIHTLSPLPQYSLHSHFSLVKSKDTVGDAR